MSRPSGPSRLLPLSGHTRLRHRPEAAASVAAGLAIRPLPRAWPCEGQRLLFARRRQQRLRRMLIEAALTGLATTLLTGLALAQPAVLRESPATTFAALIAPLQGGAAGAPLSDCP